MLLGSRETFLLCFHLIMTESKITTAVVSLNGTNYSTRKIQCKIALLKEGLGKIVTGE